jgi:hypothetical protein
MKKEIIENAKEQIQLLTEQQDQIFKDVLKQCEVDEEWLWEYLFNCTANDNSPYVQMVLSKIYK